MKESLLVCAFAVSFMVSSSAAAADDGAPEHLWWAEDLVAHVDPVLNTYGTSTSYSRWAGFDGATQYENRNVCSTFLTHALTRAYGWTNSDFKYWTGSNSPSASLYHDLIQAENGFIRLTMIDDIEAGDVLAIRYPAGSVSSGHVATARGPAVVRTATAPIVAGTTQYEVPIVDSSSSGHGPTDTRLMADGTWHTGAGFGIMRLYTDAAGVIVGHTWSTYSGSIFYDLSGRHIVVGRLE